MSASRARELARLKRKGEDGAVAEKGQETTADPTTKALIEAGAPPPKLEPERTRERRGRGLRHKPAETVEEPPIQVTTPAVEPSVPGLEFPEERLGLPETHLIYEEAGRKQGEAILEAEEKAIAKITNPLTEAAESLHARSVELAYEGKHWLGFGTYMVGTGARFARGVVGGATFPFRPLAWKETAESVHALATDAEARSHLIQHVAADPFGFSVEVGGGFVGGYFTGRGMSLISRKVGLTSPSTYALEPTKIPKRDLSSATLMPRGTWRKTWEIVRSKRGSVVLVPPRLRGPETVTIFKPMPVYAPSLLPSITGITGASSALTSGMPTMDEPLPDTRIRLRRRSIADLEEEQVVTPSMVDLEYAPPDVRPKPTLREKTRSIAFSHRRQAPPPVLTPQRFRIIGDTTQRLVQDPLQVQRQTPRQKQVQVYNPLLMQPTPRSRMIPLMGRPPPRRTRRGRPRPPLGWEMRAYPIPSPEELLLGPRPRRRKKTPKTRRKKRR